MIINASTVKFLNDTSARQLNATNANLVQPNQPGKAPKGNKTFSQETLKNCRVHAHAEDLWKQARNNFFYAERANLRAEKLSSWAAERFLPARDIGKGNIPRHLLNDTENSNIISIMLFEQAKDLVNSLAKSLQKVSKQKLISAKALLKTVQEIYGEDKDSYIMAAIKLKNIVNKYIIQIQTNLDHQEATIRANRITPKCLELRTSLAPEKRGRPSRNTTPAWARLNPCSRSWSRSPNSRPSRANHQQQKRDPFQPRQQEKAKW